jgi:acetyltransferase-like isoleucine patch superfamily enzyme
MAEARPSPAVVIRVTGTTADDGAVVEALHRVEAVAGVGAVVVPGAVIGHARLLDWVPRNSDETDAEWIDRLRERLDRSGYLLEGPSTATTGGVRQALSRLARTPLRARAQRARRRWRRLLFIRNLRWEAWLQGAKLELQVAPDLIVDKGIRIAFRPGRTRIEIGPRCIIANGVILRLGGELVLSRNVELRYDVALNVKGTLRFEGRNVLGRGAMVHADGKMVWAWGASCSEYVTVLDSHHEYDGSLVHVHDQGIEVLDVSIGAGTLLGAKAMVMPGVTIGERCLVGAGSLVTRDIPSGWIAVGSPAKPLRPVNKGEIDVT